MNTTLSDNTIESAGLHGKLSGNLEAGTYMLGGDIEIANGETLIIEPGAKLLFKQDVQFDINGLLIAEGTEKQNIIFTRYADGVTWGGLDFNNSSDDNSILSYCTIEYSNSSGISINSSSPTINHIEIKNNSIKPGGWGSGGGGIFINNSDSKITNFIVTDNSQLGNYGGGGGIYCGVGSFQLSNGIVNGNTTGWRGSGGGIFFGGEYYFEEFEEDELDNYPLITNVIISNNSSQSRGGGIYCDDYAMPYLTNLTIVNNSAFEGSGIYCHIGSKPTFINCIVTSNTGTEELFDFGGCGIECLSAKPNISYCNFWNNSPKNFNDCGSYLGVNVTINSNGNQCDAYNNIQEDPLYVDPENNNYALQSDSPCINAGDPASQYTDMGASDSLDPLAISITGSPESGNVPLEVSLFCKVDRGTAPYIFSWDFDDGTPQSQYQEESHTYETPGTYTATVTVTDAAGNKESSSKTITVYEIPNESPVCSIVATTACAGNPVTVDMQLANSDGIDLSALSVDITYDSSILSNPVAEIGEAGEAVEKTIVSNDIASDKFRVGVVSVSNNDPIPDGVVAHVSFDVDSDVPVGDSTVLDLDASGSDPDGFDVPVSGVSGEITFTTCCTGDCNGDGFVSIAEVQSAINQFLGINTPQGCNDQNNDGSISISEVQTVINNYLEGC